MAGAPTGGTTTNASSFSLNEDIKLPMGGRYQPTSSVGVFGGPRQTTPSNAQGVGSFVDGGFLPLPPHLRSKAGLPPLQQAPLTPDMMKNYNQPISPELRSNAGLPQPMALNSGVQQMAAPQQGGYNVNTASAQGLQQAQQGAATGMGYRPMAITAPSQGGLQQYTNPYESQVVQQSLDDLERSRLMAQNVGGAQASAANAFGGSRQGIAEAETNRAFADQAARTASGLRQTGYQNAQQMERDAQVRNQSAGLSGEQQRMAAGAQLGSLSNLGFGMGQTIQGRMDQQGALQQALQQNLINAGKQQYAGFTGAPAQSLQYLLQAVGGAPAVGTVEKGFEPGLFDYLSLGLGR
jgi:hypothetical protein